ncbi:MAG: hypothetical protein AAB645_00840 [Patescibacteria group bacterium]
MINKLIRFFDNLEDRVRRFLSPYPIVYAFIAGAAIILFWRGIWGVADTYELSSWSSIVLGALLLLVSGVFVSSFIGNHIIISGIKGEKKIEEKTAEEIASEESVLNKIIRKLDKLEKDIEEIKGKNNR